MWGYETQKSAHLFDLRLLDLLQGHTDLLCLLLGSLLLLWYQRTQVNTPTQVQNTHTHTQFKTTCTHTHTLSKTARTSKTNRSFQCSIPLLSFPELHRNANNPSAVTASQLPRSTLCRDSEGAYLAPPTRRHHLHPSAQRERRRGRVNLCVSPRTQKLVLENQVTRKSPRSTQLL